MLILIGIPIALGIIIAAAKPEGAVAWINERSAAVTLYYEGLRPKWTITYGWKAIVWCFHKLDKLTTGIVNDVYRAAVRACLFFYLAAFCAYATLVVIYIVVAIVIIVVGIWLLSLIFGSGSGSNYSQPIRVLRQQARPMAARTGTSRQEKDWLGNEYVEHRDENGEIVARSTIEKDWLGNEYVETRNADGEVIETSRSEKDWLGDEYEDHRNVDGERIGTSRDRTDWLGDEYVEHQDEGGDRVGESRKRRDWMGDPYTEHKP
jgi:hypothetical protein